MNRIEINGLDYLISSVKDIARAVDKPFKEMHEDSKHKEIIKLQERQIKIQEEQGKIIEKQTFLSWLLAMATIVLAIGAFLQIVISIIQMPSEVYTKIVNRLGILSYPLFAIPFLLFFALMGGIIWLIINSLIKKKN